VIAAPSATVRTDSNVHAAARTSNPMETQDARRRFRAPRTTTAAIIAAVSAGPRSKKDGRCHSVMNSEIPPTANGAKSNLGPTGVTAAATTDSRGTASKVSAERPRARPSRTRPATTTAPRTAPLNHSPWQQAQTHDRGTSHQRGRRSRTV
jgi:hypothetical protein